MRYFFLIRFAGGAVCVAAFVVATHESRVVPVSLWGPEESDALRDHELAVKSATAIPKRPGFLRTRMSGSQVLAAAMVAAKIEGDDIKGYGEPHIALSQKDGRLVWSVSFYWIGGPPGAFFGVRVEDETGDATMAPGL